MGGVITDFIVTCPDNFIGDQLNVGERARRMTCVGNYFVAAELQTVIVIDL